MKLIKYLVTLLVSLIGICLVACKNDKYDITIAEVAHSVFYAPQYVAMELGYFEEEGLNVELVNANGADKVMAALLSGDAQVGLMGPEASIYVYNGGQKNYAINFAQLTKRDGSFIVGREKIENFSLQMLEGKSILGGRKGGVPEMTLEYILKNANLIVGQDDESVLQKKGVLVRTDIQFAAMAGAFTSGEADYTTLFEPTATSIVKEGKGYILASVGELSGEIPYTAYSALKNYINENEDVIERFSNAITKALNWVHAHTALEIAEVIKPHFLELSIEDLEIVTQRHIDIDAWVETPLLKEESLNKLMDIMIEANELETKVPYEKIVTTKYIN